MAADRFLTIGTPAGSYMMADRCMTTFIPAGSIGDTSGSYMVADKLLTIFTPSGTRMHRYQITGSYMMADRCMTIFIPHGSWMVADKLLTIFTPSGTRMHRYGCIEGTRTPADRSLAIGTAHSSQGDIISNNPHLTAHDPHGRLTIRKVI